MLTPERPMLTPERSLERTENELPILEVIAANVWRVKLLPPKSALGNYSPSGIHLLGVVPSGIHLLECLAKLLPEAITAIPCLPHLVGDIQPANQRHEAAVTLPKAAVPLRSQHPVSWVKRRGIGGRDWSFRARQDS